MCYNCGCGMPDDDMGQGPALAQSNGKSITNQTFDSLAEGWNTTAEQAKQLVYSSLTGGSLDEQKQHQMDHLYEEAAKSQGMSKDQAQDETKKLLEKVLQKS